MALPCSLQFCRSGVGPERLHFKRAQGTPLQLLLVWGLHFENHSSHVTQNRVVVIALFFKIYF